ncbi:D-alanyl-D-alanine carboxypeptidase/D-alanyl-D-alanine-endopeptidase [bacterium]|nr:D-alanyl-D-alanine carboxypeptidase/D-alanyl-D-alanine-endopeptidase [bacterium]
MEKKIIGKVCISVLTVFLGLSVFASPTSIVKDAVKKADISRTALVSVTFKEVNTNKVTINYNSKLPMAAASVQKLVTTIPALDKLGDDYEFKTQLYKGADKSLYIKLGADPYLTSRTLRYMVKDLDKYKLDTLDSVYIDDSVMDRIEWGEGWQWDNTLNPYMPKFGAYNLDSNKLSVIIRPTAQGAPAEIFTSVFYPLAIENNVITSNEDNIKFSSRDYVEPDSITISGTVQGQVEHIIPINDIRKYFILRLKDSFRKNKIAYYGKFERKEVPANATLVSENKTSIEKAAYDILRKSDNMMAETIFKLSGNGTVSEAVKVFNDYYSAQNISIEGVKITDGSGVSKNNLLNSDFITAVLVKDYSKEKSIKKYMAVPGVGTLSNRMLYFKDKLFAKTGTLQNVSAIAGYLTAESGKTYAFCIIINDAKSTGFEKKAFEEYVLRTAYEAL